MTKEEVLQLEKELSFQEFNNHDAYQLGQIIVDHIEKNHLKNVRIRIVLDKDIIVTGGQSGCVPYDLFSYNSILIPQVAYMYGINPDAVILCVAIDDEEEYINRTIDFIESSCNTDVVALMLFPVMYIDYAIGQFKKVDISNTVSYKEKLQEMERLYKRPVLEFSQDGIAKCIDCIIEFLGD